MKAIHLRQAPSPCIPSRELTWNGMYLNKRTNSTEELQLKQDQDLKEEKKKEIFFEKKKNGGRKRYRDVSPLFLAS